MSGYKHGAFAEELITAVQTVITTASGISFVVGTAPINQVDETNVNKLVRLTSLKEAVTQFGYDEDFEKYTLSEATFVFLSLYRVAPVYFVNVLDPAKHKVAAEAETLTIVNSKATLSRTGGILSTVVVKVAETVKELGKDYTLGFNDNNLVIINIISGSSIKPSDKLTVNYDVLDPSKVTSKDIIGGVSTSGVYSGIELVQKMRPKFRQLPMHLIAPKFSKDTAVAQALLSNAKKLNDKFIADALIDLDTSKMKTYADAVEIKASVGLTDPHYCVCVGDVVVSGVRHNQSTHLAAVRQYITCKNNDIPNKSPSNKNYQITGYQINGVDPDLDESQAEYLNANGMIVALNTDNGWVCWGNRTACFPGNPDVKDYDIAVRQMGNYLINNCIIATMPNVDEQIDRPFIQRVETKLQNWLDGLVGSNQLISGTISFPAAENPLNELLNGNIVFSLEYCTATTVSSVTHKIAYNANDLTKVVGVA